MKIIVRQGKAEEIKEYPVSIQDIMNFINERVPIHYDDKTLPIVIKFNNYDSTSYEIYTYWSFYEFLTVMGDTFDPKYYYVTFKFYGYNEEDKSFFEYLDGVKIPYYNIEEDQNDANKLVVKNRPNGSHEDFEKARGFIEFKDWLSDEPFYTIRIEQILKSQILPMILEWDKRDE